MSIASLKKGRQQITFKNRVVDDGQFTLAVGRGSAGSGATNSVLRAVPDKMLPGHAATVLLVHCLSGIQASKKDDKGVEFSSATQQIK